MGNKNNIPSFPVYNEDATATSTDAYYTKRRRVEDWVKSPSMIIMLEEAVQGNDLRTYLKLERLWMGSRGCGSKKWREMVTSLL